MALALIEHIQDLKTYAIIFLCLFVRHFPLLIVDVDEHRLLLNIVRPCALHNSLIVNKCLFSSFHPFLLPSFALLAHVTMMEPEVFPVVILFSLQSNAL